MKLMSMKIINLLAFLNKIKKKRIRTIW